MNYYEEDYELMFSAVQKIVQSAKSVEDGLQQLLAFVRQHPDQYYAADFWKEVACTPMPFEMLKSWAREGLEKLSAYSGWSLFVLDCGYVAEDFRPIVLPFKDESAFNSSAEVIRTQIEVEMLNPSPAQSPANDMMIAYHNVAELNHPILSWETDTKHYNEEVNSDILWLTVANLALCDVLRDPVYCRTVLKNHQKVLVISGCEEIFFYVGTISAEGLKP